MFQTRSTPHPREPLEYRSSLAIRALPETDGEGFDGYASTFWAVDSYATAMAPGAFTESIKRKGDKRLLLWNHDTDEVIGKTTALKQDKVGLSFRAAVSTGTQRGRESMTLLRDEVPLGMSFGFRTTKKRSAQDSDPLDFSQQPQLKREHVDIITGVDLWEVSLVTFPANEAAIIAAVRSELERDALTSLLDALAHGDLDEGRAVLVQQLHDAWHQRIATAADEETAALHQNATPAQAQTRRDIYGEYCLVMAGLGLPVE